MSGTMIVTGASRGIGAAIARLAGTRGYAVCVNYGGSKEKAEAVVADIEASGGRAIAVQGDAGNEADIVGLFEATDAAFGPPTALVCNAATDHYTLTADIEAADVERVFRVNVVGPLVAAREAIRRMSTKQGGSGGAIVNIASIVPRLGGLPGDIIYTTSKGALHAFTRSLAKEIGPEGIRVNSVSPGYVLTDIFNEYPGGQEGAKAAAEEANPLGRIGQPEDIANLVLWLCSEEASYVSGADYESSGGL
jgi:NAD(P)-dependent dehydrogenase (short-subunit alcohol dehydrogenase family)